MKQYKILINRLTYERTQRYLNELQAGKCAGTFLQKRLQHKEFLHMAVEEFFEELIRTKHPLIFAECAVAGDGTDWNHEELSILGDVGIATPVTVYDNGKHNRPTIHASPFEATLLFIPGALLYSGNRSLPADWHEVVHMNDLNPDAYHALYHRRLYPLFCYANHCVGQQGKGAFITIPGLGCGQFAGRFRGRLGHELKQALVTFLEQYGHEFPHIRGVYYDPYQECENERLTIHHIAFLVRPFLKGNEQKPQLCAPGQYEEADDQFDDCELFSVVAWDHVSWPGNDFYGGARMTDDGVKAAATNSMAVMTGVAGRYDLQQSQYRPPAEYRNWEDVIAQNAIQIDVQERLLVF